MRGRKKTNGRCVFKASGAISRYMGRRRGGWQVWASASDQTKQAAEGVGRAFVRVYLSAAISRTLQIEWRLLDTRLIPLKTSNGQKLHQQPPSTLRGYCINLPCRHPRRTHALAHARTHSCDASTETDVCSAFRVFALRSRVPTRVPLVYHPFHLSPFPLSPSTRRELATREHDHVFFPLRVSKRPKENPFDDSSATTDVKNLCNFSPHRRPSG